MTPPITLELPGKEAKSFTNLVLDYTGTLSLDGTLLPGVAQRWSGSPRICESRC